MPPCAACPTCLGLRAPRGSCFAARVRPQQVLRLCSLSRSLGLSGRGLLLGLVVGTGCPSRPARPHCPEGRQGVCRDPGAPQPTSPGICVPRPGAGWAPARTRWRSGPRATWRHLGSNCVLSLCSRCSKAMFSKSLDIAEAHPQFSKEDRYTPCPPAPPPQPTPLRQGNLPEAGGRAGSGQAEAPEE